MYTGQNPEEERGQEVPAGSLSPKPGTGRRECQKQPPVFLSLPPRCPPSAPAPRLAVLGGHSPTPRHQAAASGSYGNHPPLQEGRREIPHQPKARPLGLLECKEVLGSLTVTQKTLLPSGEPNSLLIGQQLQPPLPSHACPHLFGCFPSTFHKEWKLEVGSAILGWGDLSAVRAGSVPATWVPLRP